ncbi:hypothetical protein BDQ12DRAFT_670661 [Crucibulum laeve]|uniref:Uncharacterized protein n=1 Tax=Crucibulum laeve TaxID=68775 RepID=A0A5C3LJB2_9AGAR|nr:hypothetical protein BDQ12DRAFT_670661 [Crucibulum laeve]
MHPSVINAYYVLWWTIPISTFLFMAFFAFGRDAIEEDRTCLVPKSDRGLPIIIPNNESGNFITTTNASELPSNLHPYKSSTPHSPLKYRNSLDNTECDTSSEFSCYILDGKPFGWHSRAGMLPTPKLTFLPIIPTTSLSYYSQLFSKNWQLKFVQTFET